MNISYWFFPLKKLLDYLVRIEKDIKKIMAAIDDLKAEVVADNASVSAELAAITARLNALGTSDADVAAVIADLQKLRATIDATTASLNSGGGVPTTT